MVDGSPVFAIDVAVLLNSGKMARERISDIWGGTSKPVIGHVLGRWVVAALLAVPLGAVAFAIADNPNTPAFARLLVAPGFVAALYLPVYGGHFLTDLGRFGVSALAMNACYYTIVRVALMRGWRALRRNKGTSE